MDFFAPLKPRQPKPKREPQIQPYRFTTIISENYPSATWAPYIRIRGKWLQTAGFDYGDRLKIHVEHGKLTITKDA